MSDALAEVDGAAMAERIAGIASRVHAAARRADREPATVTIVGVSKTFPREAIDAVYAAGIRVFAESRVQEAKEKLATPLPSDATVHLIGQLQTNKVKPAVALFDVIESVDRANLIDALAREATKQERTVNVLLQVNVAREPQKSGCDPDDAPLLLDEIVAAGNLRCLGLMTIAPLVDDPDDARKTFKDLRLLREELRQRHPDAPLDVLSMGMSNDFEVAIEEGATHVRIGRAIFGSR
ncbi:MAG: YggS family pyridoxal phosphate-dependent enzyme [Thermomicrobiales bacterium]